MIGINDQQMGIYDGRSIAFPVFALSEMNAGRSDSDHE